MRIALLISLCISVDAISQPGTLDLSFDPGTGTDVEIYSIQLQQDGRIFLGGSFHTFDGMELNSVARLLEDGSLDSTFDPGLGANSWVLSSTMLPDGKILIGGSFTSYDGRPTGRIARLNGNGSLDTTFNSSIGAGSRVRTIVVQPNGEVLIGGSFTTYDGTPCNRIARLQNDGSLDPTFNSELDLAASSSVFALTLQNDGKILVGGDFGTYAGQPRSRVARINADGSLDTSFDPGTGSSGTVHTIVVRLDGKVLIGGRFDQYDGGDRMNIALLNSDGSIDGGFDAGSELGHDEGPGSHGAYSIAQQPDGKVVVVGRFRTPTGTTGISRLNDDGSADMTFIPSAGATIHEGVSSAFLYTVVMQPDGKALIGGNMWDYEGIPRAGIARINGDNVITFEPDPVSAGVDIKPILIWPNPNEGNSFHLNMEQIPSSDALIAVVAAQGNTVHFEKRTFGSRPCESIVNLPNTLSPGIYYVQVLFEERAFAGRLTVTP